MKKQLTLFVLALISTAVHALPQGFVYLHELSPQTIQDLRYASSNNFIGKPIPGYQSKRCILTLAAAKQLAAVEQAASKKGYHLKVYDCYRPKRAVTAFYQWSQKPSETQMKKAFYPREDKRTLFDRGYISLTSGHSRGSTIDLSLVKINQIGQHPRHPSTQCFSKTTAHIDDDSINTGTRFDCLDESASIDYPDLSKEQQANRLLLRNLMTRYGFKPYEKEWWHFTLEQEPYPQTYFDFPVR